MPDIEDLVRSTITRRLQKELWRRRKKFKGVAIPALLDEYAWLGIQAEKLGLLSTSFVGKSNSKPEARP